MSENFYLFTQTNSGGSFVADEKVCPIVIVEAKSAYSANKFARDIGIYFDGVDKEIDCEHCGDRWYRVSSEIKIENETIEEIAYRYVKSRNPEGPVACRIFYLDGTVKEFIKPKKVMVETFDPITQRRKES